MQKTKGADKHNMINYYVEIANLYDKDPNKRIEFAKKALALSESLEKFDVAGRARVLLGQAYLAKTEFDSAITVYQNGLEHFKYYNDPKTKGDIYTGLGLAYERKYLFSQANEFHFKALAFYKEIKDKKLISYSLTNLGLNYWRTGYYKEAEQYFVEALKLRTEINDKKAISVSYNNLGVLHWNWGNYFKALKFYLSALELKDQVKDSTGLVLVLNNIGMLYAKFGDFDKTKEYYFNGLEVAKKINYTFGIAYSYENIGTYYLSQKLYNEADNNFQKSLQLYKEIVHKGGMCNSYNHLGNLNYELENLNAAISYYLQAYQLAAEASDRKATILAFNNLGRAYIKIKDYTNAKLYLNKALDMMVKESLPDYLRDTYEYLSISYENSGDISKAFYYLKLSKEISDSLYNSENFRVISDFKEKYEAERKEKENEVLKAKAAIQAAELEKKNYLTNFIIIVLVLITIVLVYLIYENKRKNLQNKELSLAMERAEKLNSELMETMAKLSESESTLKEINATKDKFFSIIAHDLRNPFMSIIGFLDLLSNNYYEYDEKDKVEMINSTNSLAVNTYKLLENLLQWSRLQTEGVKFYPNKINLTKLIKYVIETLKPSALLKNINISLLTSENIYLIGDEEMLNTIFRNLISNSIKFTPERGFVVTEIFNREEKIIVTITDSGIGMDASTIENLFNISKIKSRKGTKGEKGTGIGLMLVHEFIEKHNGKIFVESTIGKGSKFTIEFPKIEIVE